MIPTQNRITDSDMIMLESVDSYLQKQRVPLSCSPQEKFFVVQSAKEYLYSEIANRLPRVAGYILSANMETDEFAKGLNASLSKHLMDPICVNIIMQELGRSNDSVSNCIVGAYFTKVLNNWMSQNIKTDEKNKKGEVVNAAPKLEVQIEPVKHIDAAINMLLGFMIAQVKAKCVNLNESECKAVAACLAINNSSTVIDLINSDLPITADLFDIILAVYGSLDNIMRDVLLLEKTNADLPTKLSTNQTAFVDSLKRWVYRNLQGIPIQQSYQFLVATYGAINNIDISNKFINLRDCGNQYPNIVELNKQLFVK